MRILLIIPNLTSASICFSQDIEKEPERFKSSWIRNPITLGSSIGFNSTYSYSLGSSKLSISLSYNIFVIIKIMTDVVK